MIDDFLLSLSFLTRLPVSPRNPPTAGPVTTFGLAGAMGFFPVIGAVIGAAVGLVYLLCRQAWPAWPAALLAIASGILLTGGLHEDGLADCADGFGGGSDPAGKLAIMRDSRIGSYGALALGLSLLLRAAALAAIDQPLAVIKALIVSHSLARAALPMVMALLPAASDRGLAAAAGRPSRMATGGALLFALFLAALLLPGPASLAAIVAAAGATAMTARLAKQQIGGYSGDLLGAVEQLVEIATMLAILAVMRP